MNRKIANSLGLAALILAVAFGGEWLQSHGLLPQGSDRISGLCMAIVLVWLGNMLPKQTEDRCGTQPGETFRTKRFVGIAFILGGIGHGLIWLLAPAGVVADLAMIPVAAALVVALAAFLRGKLA